MAHSDLYPIAKTTGPTCSIASGLFSLQWQVFMQAQLDNLSKRLDTSFRMYTRKEQVKHRLLTRWLSSFCYSMVMIPSGIFVRKAIVFLANKSDAASAQSICDHWHKTTKHLCSFLLGSLIWIFARPYFHYWKLFLIFRIH